VQHDDPRGAKETKFAPAGGSLHAYQPGDRDDGEAAPTCRHGPGTLPPSARASRILAGHPEGFHECFAAIYSDAAEAIAARRSGTTVDPMALRFPNAEDGVLGVRFVDAVVAASAADGAWTSV